MSEVVTIGVLGCGTVGSSVLRLLEEHAQDIRQRSGCRFDVYRVAVQDPERGRDVPVDPDRFTTNARDVVADPQVEVVVELMGGIEPARSLILEALRSGKSVVTANKVLLANHGAELFEAAAQSGGELYFEAAVAGGIPLIRPLRESLPAERIARVLGIVNGTTNYVLTRMAEDGTSFEEALAQAQELGFAERDPTDDIEGYDAAAKCAVLASIAFNTRVVAGDVYREGIAGVRAEDLRVAGRLGYVVKLIAVAELEQGDVAVRVHPAMIPRDHPLAAVRDSYNAVFVEGPNVERLMFYGPGAGGRATAVAVLGDLITAARDLATGRRSFEFPWYADRRVRPMDRHESQYYLLLDVVDRPGVLARIAGVFGENGVSIRDVWQEGTGEEALLVMITHRANEGALQRTVRDLHELDVVVEVRSVMRVEGVE